MSRLLKPLFLFTLLFVGETVFSQERKLDKAEKQYNKYEYIDAQETYLKVAKKGYKSVELYENLGNSYYFNSQFEEASKWYQELIKSFPEEIEPEYYFRYAQTLKSVERYEDADVYMNKFFEANEEDQRGLLFKKEPNYLNRIDFQSGRFKIENSSINSSYTDFGTAFYGRFVVFSSSRDTSTFKKSIHQWNEEPFLELYKTEYNPTNGELSEIEKLNDKINSKFHESTPIFTKDGQTIYFTRNNYSDSRYGIDTKKTNRLKIYRSYKNTQGGWTTPQNLSINNDEYSTAHPALSPDEKRLYFSSDMPGGQGQSDIYEVVINTDGSLGEPKNLGKRINTEGKETFPFISASSDLYFSSDGHIGLGGLDIYVTSLKPQTEEEGLVVNIGKPVNGTKDDFAFIVDEESKRGYFSSNRDGGKGKDDIYSFLQLEDLKDFCEITLTGVVTDKDTGELLAGAKVSVYDSSNNLLESYLVGPDAFYSHKVKCGSKYFVRVEKEEYVTGEELVNTPEETQTLDIPIALETKIKSANIGDDLGEILALNPIYFDFDQSYIRADAAVELAKVIEVMEAYPDMIIDVRSHTDSHGDDSYNLWLSEERAKSTIKHMVKKGIDTKRLSSKGYGESQGVNDCGNETNCTKQEYQLNRRSEFIIVK